jgi:hypothetical protein
MEVGELMTSGPQPTDPQWPSPGWGAYPTAEPPGLRAGPGYGRTPAPRRRRRAAVIVGGLVAVAAVAVAAVLVINRSSVPDGPRSASEAVRLYVEALARGDADGALALANDKPADTSLLTDEILRRQLAKAPISDIKILSSPNESSVHVSAKFGDQISDTTIAVTPPAPGQPWKLDHAAVAIKTAGAAAPALAASISLFGVPVPKSGVAYVFPGWQDLGTTNPYVTVKSILAQPVLLNGLVTVGSMNLLPKFTITDTGKAATTAAITAALTQCAQSNQLQPPGCPQSLPPAGFVDGTVSWAGVQPNGIDVGSFFDEQHGTVTFLGIANFQGLTVQQSTGGPFTMAQLQVGVNGTADITQAPPKVAIRSPR